MKDEDSIFNITVIPKILIRQGLAYTVLKFVEYLNSLNLAEELVLRNVKRSENVNFILLDCDDEFYRYFMLPMSLSKTSSVVRQNVLDSANKVRYFLKASDYPLFLRILC